MNGNGTLATRGTHKVAFVVTLEYTAILATDSTTFAGHGLSPNPTEVFIEFTAPLKVAYAVSLTQGNALMLAWGSLTKPVGTYLTLGTRHRFLPLATTIYSGTGLKPFLDT